MNCQPYLRISFLTVFVSLGLCARGESLNPEIDYFPSRLHAVIYRNWDIVSHERLAGTLGTDIKTIKRAGNGLALPPVTPPTAEESRRNVEIILRRNWGILTRPQIEQLLGYTAAQLDEF